MRKIERKNKILIIIVLIPLIFIAQFYIFKFGIISPMVKGVDIKIIQGEYIQDFDKYVVKQGEQVTLSAGNYIKIPTYAKDPNVKFRILDDSNTIKLYDQNKHENNTVVLEGVKTGYTSIAIMKNSRVLQKVTVLVVNPVVEDLNVALDGSLNYVGDKAEFSSDVEVDYKEFSNSYDVTYESSNEEVLKVNNNKVEAVGVGHATIYAKSKNKVEALRYNIVAKIKDIEIQSRFDISVGEQIKLSPKVITLPKNLKPPAIKYKFSQAKLPIERCVTIDENGRITGIRAGTEKITISCGVGKNKKIQVVTINVKENSILDDIINIIFSKYFVDEDNDLKLEISWDVLNGASNYDIYIKNNLTGNDYDLCNSVTQEYFMENKKVELTIPHENEEKEFNYDIYIVGRNEEGTSKPSKIININGLFTDNNEDEESDVQEEKN